MDWFRWHHGTVTDPKWRVVAADTRQPIAIVVAVWALMLEEASQNKPRGHITGWKDRVAAAALDVPIEAVRAIREAMQADGLVLEGDYLTGWEKRQPKREDGSAERAHRWRRRQDEPDPPNAPERTRTHPNADAAPEEIREEEKRAEQTNGASAPSSAGADAVRLVWDHWLQVSGRARSKLTKERRQKIRSRLRTYTAAELCQAVDGAHLNPFYLGENDRATYYGNVETIFKNDTVVAQHVEYAQNPPSDNPTLTVIPGGLLDREAEDQAAARREREEAERQAAAVAAWQEAVLARYRAEPREVQEQFAAKARPEFEHLRETLPETYRRAMRQRVCELYGAHIGVPLEHALRAS